MLISDILTSKNKSKAPALQTTLERLCYAELYERSNALADMLRKILKQRASVAVWMPNGISYVVSYFAVQIAECVCVPILPQTPISDLENAVLQCDCIVLMTDNTGTQRLMKSGAKLTCSVLNVENYTLLQTTNHEVHFEGDCDVAVMLRTSGTTGNTKIVMLTHDNLLSNVKAICEAYHIEPRDRTLVLLPLQLSSAHIQMLTHFYMGAEMILSEGRFSHLQMYRTLSEKSVTDISATPFVLKCLVDYAPKRYAFPELKRVGVGGAVVSSDLLENSVKRYPHVTFFHYYGQTEASPRVCHMVQKGVPSKAGTVGKPLNGVFVKVDDPDEYGRGEILVRGPNVMRGYYKNHAATSEALGGGWLHTGDIGWLDKEGDLYICGRKRNVIITGGLNVHPEEVEEVLCKYPGIMEAIVSGIPDEMFQEVPVARIVCETGSVDVEKVRMYCKQHLASYKVPVEIIVNESLEKTESGKLKRS